MNININLPNLDPSSDIGVRLQYLSNIYNQAYSIGSVAFSTLLSLVNQLVVDMVSAYLNNDIPGVQNHYNNEITNIESEKVSSYEAWEIGLRDVFICPPPFSVP